MREIQTTVLNKIQPGLNPVFIIAPDAKDATPLALWLSDHLKIQGTSSDLNKPAGSGTNFFSTPETQHFFHLAETKNRNSKESRDKIKFILDKDFDNNILWGLQCSYDAFFSLDLASLYPNAFFIFIYGAPLPATAAPGLAKQAYDFILAHRQTSVALHYNNTLHLGKLILDVLPFDTNSINPGPGSSDEIKSLRSNYYAGIMLAGSSGGAQVLDDLFDQENPLVKNDLWFSGASVAAILITGNVPAGDILAEKIGQLCGSLFSCPHIYLLCKNDADTRVATALAGEQFKGVPIQAYTSGSNTLTLLNKIIQESTATTLIIDHLNLSYSFLDTLSPFKNEQPPVFSFGNILASKIINIISGKISLPDVLATHMALDNITFSKATWASLNGFDTLLPENVMLWDFCIRALTVTGSYGIECAAEIAKQSIPYSSPVLNEDSYAAVIEKHKDLYAANLNQVLLLVSENQFVPQNEILTLNHKISTLDVFLKHSKDEVKSLNDFSINLQTRIKVLENTRYFRWSERFRHYKKIFFKEKKPGKGALKRILDFMLFIFTKPGFRILRKVIKKIFKKLYLIAEDRPVNIVYLDDDAPRDAGAKQANYHDWMANKLDTTLLRDEYTSGIQRLDFKPKVSVIMPVYNPPIEFLKRAIESVADQLYNNWELCIADDCSTNPQIKRLISSYMLKDSRIKAVFRTENGHISACSNSALELVTGDYVFCLDHDDLLTPNCIFEVVKHLNAHPDDEIIYSDEDKIDDAGTYSTPYFKPDWAPANLLAKNYITHITVYKKQLIDVLGGYRIGFEGSQDYDLVLRGSELTDKIGHIPKVLYHWRIHSASAAQEADVKPYAFFAAKKALEEALVRRNTPGDVQYLPGLMGYRVKYKVTAPGKVSIIIPTKDHAKLTQNTIDSIIALTDYADYEIIVLNNNSTTKEFFELMHSYKEKHGTIFKCIDAAFPFNFSKLINVGVANSTGDYVLMLNNDVEIIHADWLTRLVSFAQQDKTGAVGVKLLYPDDNIQHAGTVIGLGGVAGHVLVNFYKDDPGYFNYLQSTTNYSAVTAACLMCRRNVFDEVGGMDELLEVEFNDVDFCLKIMDRGYYNIYVPDVVLYHYESATRGHPHQNKVSYERHIRESKYFLDKWAKYIKNDPNYNPNLRYDVQDFRVNYNA